MKKGIFCAIWIVLNITGILFGQEQIPQLMNYQGYLTDAEGNPMNGSHTLVFRLYDAETEGTELWAETRTITVLDGFFNILLGSIGSIPYSTFESDNVYLTLKIGDDPEMMPRKHLVSVGYAFRAHTADHAGGFDPDRFVETINRIRSDSGNVDLVAGNNMTITSDSLNHQIIISTSGSTQEEPCWNLAGNSNTTPGTDFLGTTDEKPFELKVNSERALRIEPKDICANIIGGSSLNVVE